MVIQEVGEFSFKDVQVYFFYVRLGLQFVLNETEKCSVFCSHSTYEYKGKVGYMQYFAACFMNCLQAKQLYNIVIVKKQRQWGALDDSDYYVYKEWFKHYVIKYLDFVSREV